VKLEQTFEVDAPLQRVWEALIDVQRVAPCLPGAAITEAGEDGTYEGTFSAKVGPASVSFKGTLKMENVDEASHTATMQANGTNRRGQGGAKATIVSRVSEKEGGGTKVEIDTDYSITGPLARLGRGGMIEDVGNRLLRDFASCLEQQLAYEEAKEAAPVETAASAPSGEAEEGAAAYTAVPDAPTVQKVPDVPPPPRPAPPQAKPIGGIRLMLDVLVGRIKRLLGRRS
jgi:carbon monoxide dehydrogenase subunit G